MAVAFDAVTQSLEGSVNNPMTFTHTPVGTPRGVLVFCVQNQAAADPFGAASYGGVAMTAVSGGYAVADGGSSGTRGSCKAYFLGSSIPTGAQTVSIANNTAISGSRVLYCITVTAAGDTAISGTPVLIQTSTDPTEQNVDTGATAALRFAGLWSEFNNLTSDVVGANSTLVSDRDFGNEITRVVRETTGGSGSRPVGFEGAATGYHAIVHLAIAESGGGGGGAITRSFAVIVG